MCRPALRGTSVDALDFALPVVQADLMPDKTGAHPIPPTHADAEGRFEAGVNTRNGQGGYSGISIRRDVEANSRRARTATVRAVVTSMATGPISQPSAPREK